MKAGSETKMVAGNGSATKMVKMKVLREFSLIGEDGKTYQGTAGSTDKPQIVSVPEDIATELERKFTGTFNHLGTVSEGQTKRHEITRAVRV